MDKILYFSVTGTKIKATNAIDITSHSENWFRCQFSFDSTWTALEDKIAVFTNDKKTYVAQAINSSNSCYIPAKVLTKAGYVFIGVLHSDAEETIPTEWAVLKVAEGIDTGNAPPPPEQSVYAKLLYDTAEALEFAREVRDGAAAGEYSASIALGTVAAGDTASITNSGTDQDAVLNFVLPRGEKGESGDPFVYTDFTPEQLADLTGPQGETGERGETGATGKGVASVTLTSGNHAPGTTDTYTITFTDSSTTNFTVYNGNDGEGSNNNIIGPITTSGTSIAYTATVDGMTAYVDGQTFLVQFNVTNASYPTINFNDLGAKNIYVQHADAFAQVVSNTFAIHHWYLISYSTSTNAFVVISPHGALVHTTLSATLTNKTLTSPKINENVVLTATATQLNTLVANTSGTNTGDETDSTIKTKLGITTLSGTNTGDQDLSEMVNKDGTIAMDHLTVGSRLGTVGANSTILGFNCTASGLYSCAEGSVSTASGARAHAEGHDTTASGHCSHAQNEDTIAQGLSQTAIGTHNIAQGTQGSKVSTDHAFIIGNGTSDDARSNALSVTWGGDVLAAGAISGSNLSGTNTGDETDSTIKTKLGITTLSGSNTGDQDLSGLVPKTTTVNGHALSSNVSVTASDVGLGNVTNESKATMFSGAALTGTPTAPTASANTNTTQIATTAYVVGQAGTANPNMDGSVAVGTSLLYARADHVHPSDTSRLANIVEDTTPQLGGELDQNAHSIGGNEYDNGNSGTSKAIDWTKGNHQKVTMTGNCTFTFTAPSKPCMLSLRIINDGTAGRTRTFPTIKYPGGTAPTWTTTANAIDILSLYYDGTTYYGQAGLAFA